MKEMVKSSEEDADDLSSFDCLPDEIILQILNKIFDLKSLCCCYLVSKRFSLIVFQVEAISFIPPLLNPNAVSDVFPSTPIPRKLYSSFLFATNFLSKFRGVKSLSIQFPSFSHQRAIDNRFLFKWKANIGSSVESFIFLSPDSICDKDSGNGDEEDTGLTNDLLSQKFAISIQCLKEVIAWHMLLMYAVKDLPTLEEVSITDSGRRGRLSLSGEKLRQVKEWTHSASETEFNRVQLPNFVSKCYIPVLKLPVSGYVMKGVFCTRVEGGNEGLMNSDDCFEDKEGAAYKEAVKEILEKDMMDYSHYDVYIV